MSEEVKTAKNEVQILRDAFEGMKGRQPKSDQELKEWLATDEGKEATMFEFRVFFALRRNWTRLNDRFAGSNGKLILGACPCPLWVIRQCKKSCLLYPRKRTCAVQLGMSALCQ